MLPLIERQTLLAFARETIAAKLEGRPAPPMPDAGHTRSGAFVTITVAGDLRGCIGHPAGERPLVEVIRECAVASAIEDPRFSPMTADELPDAEIEISVLGPIEPVSDVADIDVGRHGLIVEQGLWRGLLLPQVATEHHWDRDTFLAHTCRKAGLPVTAWRTGAKIFKFEAEVFSEALTAR